MAEPHSSSSSRPLHLTFTLALLALLLAACAPTMPRSYVVLVPDPDGAVGQVIVSGAKGQQVLTQAGMVAGTDGSAVKSVLDDEQVNAAFGAAKAAQPALPEHFMLYFVLGSTRLTPQSEELLLSIMEHWKSKTQGSVREAVVIGHTDTVGSDSDNELLSLQRAKIVAQRLSDSGLKMASITLESHGEKHLLIPTADETPEPRNRRVQVTIR